MIKYSKYKSSEIDWLGDIPIDWEVKRVKDIFTLERGKFTHRPRNDEKMFENGTYPFIQTGDVAKSNKYITNFKQVLNSSGIKVSKEFKKGTLLMTIAANIGDVSILGYDSYFTDSIVAFKTKFNVDYYYYYLSISKKELDLVKVTNTQDNLNLERLNAILKLCPPLKTQIQIANYLDTKTQSIDKKINLLNQKANCYKEYRKSLINEAVCKGLDKNVSTKENDLGFYVNKKYQSYRLKDLGYLYSGLSGKSGDDFNQDENPHNKEFIPFTNIANNTYLKKDHLGTVVVFDNENQNRVQKGDIFFLMSSEGYGDIGKSAILDDDLNETYLNSFCKGYRVTDRKINAYFLNYLLLSDNYRKLMMIEGKGFTRINLKMEKVNDFIVFIPNSIDEQNKTVNYLDDKTQTIDKIIFNINTQIQTLKELRKTLINDAVTGKIKVTND